MRPVVGEPPTHVIVLATLGAPQRRLLGRRRARSADPEPDPTPVPTARLTVIDTSPPGEGVEAWLSAGEHHQALDEALAVANRMLSAHRVAAADPHARDVGLEGALVARVGYGRGEQVAEGRWEEAVEVPLDGAPRGRRRVAALRPQERLAALLGGRDAPLACEELTLRARADLDAGRLREAALQVRVALEAALAELEEAAGPRVPDMGERVAELRERRAAVGDAANQALAGRLSDEAASAVVVTVERLEAALRARSAAGFG